METVGRGFEAVKRFEGRDIKLPERSTKHSAGYDFYACEDVTIPSFTTDLQFMADNKLRPTNEAVVKPFCIKTGVKAYMENDEVLQIFVRSSAPSKLGLVMANSTGIIDSDYYGNPDNDGEIGFLVYNLNPYPIDIQKGTKIGQGIFTKFLITNDDNAEGERLGGYGSTGK